MSLIDSPAPLGLLGDDGAVVVGEGGGGGLGDRRGVVVDHAREGEHADHERHRNGAAEEGDERAHSPRMRARVFDRCLKTAPSSVILTFSSDAEAS